MKLNVLKTVFFTSNIFFVSHSIAMESNDNSHLFRTNWLTCHVTNVLYPSSQGAVRINVVKYDYKYWGNSVDPYGRIELTPEWFTESGQRTSIEWITSPHFPRYSDWNGKVLKRSGWHDLLPIWAWRADEFEIDIVTGKGYYRSSTKKVLDFKSTININYEFDDCKLISG